MKDSTMMPGKAGALPLEAQYLYHRGLFLSQKGKKELAVRNLKMAVTLAPTFCEAHNVLGNCYDELGQPEEAIRQFQKVLALNPGHAAARFKLALMQRKAAHSSSGRKAIVPDSATQKKEYFGTMKTEADTQQFLRCLAFLPETG